MDDTRKDEVLAQVKRWSATVGRGDCTREYAAQEIVGYFCRPWLSAAEVDEIAKLARRKLPRGR